MVSFWGGYDKEVCFVPLIVCNGLWKFDAVTENCSLCFHPGRIAKPFVKHSRRVVYFKTNSSSGLMEGRYSQDLRCLWEDYKILR